MNIYTKLINKSHFSSAEQILADYILNNNEKVMHFSIRKLSKQSGVSISTIYRVFEKLNVSGFSELKSLLMTQKESFQTEQYSVDYNYPFQKSNTHYQIMTKLKSLYNASVESTINQINLDCFLKAIQQMQKCQTIFFLTSDIYAPLCLCAKQQYIYVSKHVEVVPFQVDISNYNLITKKDFVILVTDYLTPTSLAAIKHFHTSGIPMLLISNEIKKEHASLIDLHFKLCPYENKVDKISNYASRISAQFLFDALYSAYFNLDYEKHIQRKTSLYTQKS